MKTFSASIVVLLGLFEPAIAAPVSPTGGAAAAPEIGSVNLVFARGHSQKIISYRSALPPGAIGQLDCSKVLGRHAKAFELEARRANPTIAEWQLLSTQCNAANDPWVKIVQRVPVTNAAANEE